MYPTKYVHIKSTTVYAPRRNWDFPQPPHPQASVPPPPCFWGEGNTRWRERGWESPNSDEGRTLWYSLYVRTLWCTLRTGTVYVFITFKWYSVSLKTLRTTLVSLLPTFIIFFIRLLGLVFWGRIRIQNQTFRIITLITKHVNAHFYEYVKFFLPFNMILKSESGSVTSKNSYSGSSLK